MKDFDKIIIVKMNLSKNEKKEMEEYINNNLLNKPYPYKFFAPFTKNSMKTFYCSSLVWRAHISSWKYVDLEYLEGDWIIWPIELVLSENAWDRFSIKVN